MKRKGNLFDKICSFENIYSAYLKARKGKKLKKEVLLFNYNLEANLINLEKS